MKRMALFVFNGDPMCFIHVLLNALDLKQRGYEGGVVVEGAATGLLPELTRPGHPLHQLWNRVREAGWVLGVCRACATKMGTLDAARDQQLVLLDDMNGHPGIAGWRDRGYEIITF